jgi:hypothetical protein
LSFQPRALLLAYGSAYSGSLAKQRRKAATAVTTALSPIGERSRSIGKSLTRQCTVCGGFISKRMWLRHFNHLCPGSSSDGGSGGDN